MCTGNTDCTDTSLIVIPTGSTGNSGANGTNGTNGTNGANGNFGGFSARFLFDATTGGDPANTFLKFDNTTLSSVTGISVNNINADNVDHSNFLDSFVNTIDGLNNYGLIRIWKRFDSNTFWDGRIKDNATLAAGETFVVEHIQSNGAFAAGDELILSYTANGQGAAQAKEVLSATYPGTSNNTITPTSLGSYTILPGTLIGNGDQIVASATLSISGALFSNMYATIQVGATQITPGGNPWIIGKGVNKLLVDFDITRINTTTAYLRMTSLLVSPSGVSLNSFVNTTVIPFVWTSSNVIEVLGYSDASGSSAITMDQLIIKNFNI